MNNTVSLSAIASFTVVAQELNFTRAADVLHITPSAVSHRIKLLEKQLGVELFIRQSQGVKLTLAGQALLKHSTLGMKNIQYGIQQSQFANKAEKLNIAVIPSLSQTWLIPRLCSFKKAYPQIEIELIHSDQLVDFSNTQADCHLHFGSGHYQGLEAVFLSHEIAFAVCHPQLIEDSCSSELNDLIQHNDLLHYKAGIEDQPGGIGWAQWLEEFSIDKPENLQHSWFSHVAMVLCSARHGQGIALGWGKIVEQDLAAGNVVKIGSKTMQTKYDYYLVAPQANWKNPAVMVFKQWLVTQMQNTTQ
ncbi:MAG: LysR family transcriptional regulator [Oceanospirillaceae bacterium]